MTRPHTSAHTTGIVIALILSIASFALAWVAYNRSGVDLEQKIATQAADAQQEFNLAMQRFELQTKLWWLEAKIEAGATYEEIEQEMQEIEQDAQRLYVSAELETRQEWEEFQQEFNQLEAEIRDESADAVNTLESLLERLERDIRTDER